MSADVAQAEMFRSLHVPGDPVLLPNPWDPGSAKLFAALGFRALATTSGGFAATLGRRDGSVTRAEALQHAAQIVEATDLPVSADLENGFVDDPEDVAETVRLAVDTGLAGCSIEDFTGRPVDPIYEEGLAAERVQAAAEAAHAANPAFVLTARCEQFLHGRPDLDSTVARLQSFEAAGADALYAPGASSPGDIQSIVSSTTLPVNVLAMPGAPTVFELGALGVSRVSVGSAFSLVAIAAVADAAREFLNDGTYDFWNSALPGMQLAHQTFA
jgi:2-methylisocitrate lyase-like PEP mutase family enzyme